MKLNEFLTWGDEIANAAGELRRLSLDGGTFSAYID